MKFTIVQHLFVAIASLICVGISFVATAAPLQQGSATVNDDGIIFDWNKAPWQGVVEWFADEAGLILEEVDQYPEGTFSLKSDRPLSPVEAIDELNHKLRLSEPPKTLLRNGSRLYLVDAKRELPAELVETIDVSELDNRGKYEVLQAIFDVSGLDFEEIQNQVRQRIQSHNERFFQPYADTRELFVRETGENLRFIRDLVLRAKAAGTPTWADLTLEHISAELFLQQISSVYELDENYSNPDGTLKMSVDSTAGAQRIVIRGTPALINDLEGAAKMYDRKPKSMAASPDDPVRLEQYSVPRDSKETFEVIDRLLFDAGGGARVIQGSETGKITVMGRNSDHALVLEYFSLLDAGAGFKTVQLVNGDAGDIMLATQTVLGITAENASENVSMLANTDRDFIIVKGSPAQVMEAVQIIEELDRNAAPVSDGLRTKRRVIPMPPGDRDRILRSLEDYLPTLGRENLFQVRPPQQTEGDSDSLFRRRERSRDMKDEGASLFGKGLYEFAICVNPLMAMQLSSSLLQDPEQASPGDEINRQGYVPPKQVETVPGAPVRIWGTEFGIIVESDDLDAGDDVVYLIDSQLDLDAEDAKPTVYQLKHCEAGYMKQLLESLYGLESSGGGGGGGILGGLADNVMGQAGGDMVDSLFGGGLGGGGSASATLEGDVAFGTDGRLNYLWVTGATMGDLELIDESIKLFDVSTPPQNPETAGQIFDIEVKHRDVEEMKTQVETLMEVYFTDAEAKQGGGGNDAANMMKMMRQMTGGGGKGGGDAEEKKPRGYLSVDTKTSKLLFMGPKFIFVQVEALVFALDQPEVIIPPRMKDFDLGGEDAGRVAGLLKDLLGSDKVEISGEDGSSEEGGAEGNGQSKTNAAAGQASKAQADQQKAAEAARNNFIQMMRARAGGGGNRGGGGTRGGGGGGRGGGGGGGRGGRGGR